MVSYLYSLGFEPSKIVRDDYWYRSPLRTENTPSFKINRRLNRWYDHGMGKGGSIIDFGMLFFKCSFAEFLKNGGSAVSQPAVQAPLPGGISQKESKIIIYREKSLESQALVKYLRQRKIPMGIARRFCREISYKINDHSYYGIGFKNDMGGFEIRNPYFKSSSSPKAATTLSCNSGEVLVFEGFFDFLSYRAATAQHKEKKDFVILNSLSFIEKMRPFMEEHKTIRLFLDRDQAGMETARRALEWSSKYKDESPMYSGYKDVSEWFMNCAETERRKLRPGLKP